MESPKILKTLIMKNPDDEDGAQASNGYVGGKAESLNGGCNVNGDGAVVEGEVGCVNVEGNPASSVELGNKCLDKGVTKCSELGSLAGCENAGGEEEEVEGVLNDGLEGSKDVLVDSAEDAAKSVDALEIIVDEVVDGLEGEADQSRDSVKIQDVTDAEGSFSVGDLVWSMAKNNIWWPGVICDPLDVPKQAMKSRVSDKLLVRHFGSKTLVWSPSSHLKHFLESFKEMSGQGKSKSFLGAIEKAAEEVGRRVKLEMSCSCISKEIRARLIGRNKEDFKPWYVSNEAAVVHFNPTSFIQRVKSLARMSYVPGVVETAVAQGNVAVYYSYFGHSQMYLRHLREVDVTGEEGVEEGVHQSPDTSIEENPKLGAEDTAGKGFESRERKKSKYLSFPFVDPSAAKALRDPTDSSESSGKRSASSSKRLPGKNARKLAPASSSGDLKDLKVSIAQLLSELRDTSRGCFYLNGNTILKSTFDFFCQFRHFAYSDGDSASSWYNDDGVFEKDGLEVVHAASPLSEVKHAKRQRKSATNKSEALNSEPAMDQDVNPQATPVPKAQTKSRKRKETAVIDHQTGKVDGVPDLNVNGNASKKRIRKSSEKGKAPEPKKRKNQRDCIAASEHEPENGLMEANVERHFGENPASLNAKTVPGSAQNDTVNDCEQKDLLPTGIKSKKKAENPNSGLPDLNGNGLEPNSSSSVKDPMASQPAAGGGQELPLSVIKSNLEMMTKMMDQSGGNLSPEMRVKLETDVQNLLKKIKDMTGGSSST
uniref:PWWP domain-containing protein n=1 Tax=Kalanchoe fedtschenkoi TaxID=63787 RepID=A0A7N0T5X5_KALFE